VTRALVLVVAVVSAALAPVTEASADASCPDARPCLVVTWTGTSSGSQVVTLDDLRAWADLTDPPYQTRVVAGTDPQSEPRPGQALSLHHLLGQLTPPIAAATVTFTEAPHRNSAPSTLATADLGDPSDPGFPFPDGLMPAVYIVGPDDAIGYIRPLRSSTDTNGDDFWQTDSGGALQLVVHTTGRLASPTLTPASHKVAPGARDSFTATFPSDPGTALTYTWTFGDGATNASRTASSSHTYTTPGTYHASVTVRGDDGSYGQSPAVMITVGPRPSSTPTSTRPPGTGSSPDPHAPSTGPNKGTGHRAGASATGRPAPTSRPATSSPAAPSPVAVPSANPGPPTDLSGTQVSGVLLSSSGAQTRTSGGGETAPAARRDTTTPDGQDPALAGIPVGLLLLAAGALRESRWRRVRRRSPGGTE
jgi:PKD repeat protein